jgi:hypothetical protein
METPTTLLTASGYTPAVKAQIEQTVEQDAENIGQVIIGDVEDLALSQPINNKIEIPGVGDSLPVGFTVPFTGKRYTGDLEVITENGKVYLVFKASPTS